MRILFAADVPPDPHSGAAGTEWQTIQALRRQGHVVDEIWAADLPHRIRHGNLHYLFELPRGFRSAIRGRCSRNQYDAIHVNQGHCYLAAVEHERARRPGVFVCRSHGLDDHMEIVLAPWRRRLGIRARSGTKALLGGALDTLLRRHDHLAYRHASGVLVSSSLDAEYLIRDRGVLPERVCRIPQAPAEAFVASDAPPLTRQRLFQLLHVGGFAYWKGVHAIAGALNILAESSEPWEMSWVCRESEHAEVRRLLSADAQSRVRLTCWMPQEALVEVHDRHGIFISPSLFDGFGKVFLEAMARGECVIGTRTGGMRDIIRDGENGFLVDFHDPDGIAKIVRELWASPSRAEEVGLSAAREARRYSWDRVARATVGFYERLQALGPRSGAGRA